MKRMKLQEVCEVYSGYAIKEFHDSDEGYPVIKIGNICSDGTLDLEKCQFTNDSVNDKYYSKKGDIYVALSGATTGKIGIINTDDKYIINQRVGIVRKIDKEIPDQYIKYFLMNKTEKILEDASGCAQPNISPKQVGQYEFPKIDYFEMNQISYILDKVSSVITERKLELQKLDDLIKARFVEMFGNVRLNPNGYQLFKIGELIRNCEAGWSGNGTQRERKENEIAVLKVSSVTKGYFIPEECKVLDDQENIKKYVSPEKGDLIFSRANTREMVGATAIIFEDYPKLILPDKLWKIKFTDDVNVFYMKYILSSKYIREQFSAASTGTSGSMFNVSMEKFKNIEVSVAPLDMQNEFRKFVIQVDKSKFAVQKSLEEAQLLFDSLMQKYFG